MTESEVVTSAAIEPIDSGYIGCYNDMISDRVMTSVVTMTDLTQEVFSCNFVVRCFSKIMQHVAKKLTFLYLPSICANR